MRRVMAFLIALLLLVPFMIPVLGLVPGDTGERYVYYEDSFDDYAEGDNAASTPMSRRFRLDAQAIGDGSIKINKDASGNLYLNSRVFTQVYTEKEIPDGYTFSADVLEMQGDYQAGIFLRGIPMGTAFYETDQDPEHSNSIGYSGVFLYGYRDRFCVNVKTYDAKRSSKVRNNVFSFDLPKGATFDNKTYTNVRVEDDGKEMEIYVADTLICRLEMSDPSSVREKVNCFKSIKVYDANKKELAALTDTLVRGDGKSVIGWATRVAVLALDNLYIATYKEFLPEDDGEEITTAPEVIPDKPLDDDSTTSYETDEDLVADGAGAVRLPATSITHSDRKYNWLHADQKTYTYDFSTEDLQAYADDPNLATASLRTNMIFANGVLSCKAKKTFSFGSSMFLGDDYGLYGGTLSFDLKLTDGYLAAGVRLSKQAAKTVHRGIWFRIEKDCVVLKEPETNIAVRVPLESTDKVRNFRIEDRVECIVLFCDDKELVQVEYGSDGALKFRTPDRVLWAKADSSRVQSSGYFTLFANSLEGYVDNLSFTHTEVTVDMKNMDTRTIDFSSWIATDDRGRTTPTAETTGGVKSKKQVGLFYFVAHTGDDSQIPKDITAKYLEVGSRKLTAYLQDPSTTGGFYWAEPYFGYYRNTDSWVQRKHALMLEAAGVDFIFVDLTNGATYPDGLFSLFDTWLEMRKEGIMTPQICLFAHDSINADLSQLRGSVLSDENMKKYDELFYRYEGKPLFMGNYSKASPEQQSFLDTYFTVRDCWAWQDADGMWNWLQEYKINDDGSVSYVNGGPGRNADGKFEELALCIGHHPTTSKGRSYVNTVAPAASGAYGFSLDSGAGAGFAGQFEAIQKLDPDLILITGWNEWVAGLNHDVSGKNKFAGTPTTGFYMVDQFNTEYSRDAEPMRLRQGEEVGFGDNYYYQMASIIRTFKGQDTIPTASGQGTVKLGDIGAWSNVGPEYRDYIGDANLRSVAGMYAGYTYVDNTARNDFAYAKVSQDSDYLYFMVECANNIEIDDGANWMNLFINIDNDATTGWEGYDFVLNRRRDSHYVSIESLADGWRGEDAGQALYTLEGKTMVIRVSKRVLGVKGDVEKMLFKWADNSTLTGNVMEFMDRGDTAPNDRYAYQYIGSAGNTTTIDYVMEDANGKLYALRDEWAALGKLKSNHTGDETETTVPTEVTTNGDVTDDAVTTDAATTDQTGKKGCGSVLTAAAAMPVLIAFGVCMLRKNKRESE